MMLFNFIDDPDAAHEWRVINDTVMGGVSESTFEPTNTGAAFHGTVSLAHGGGFASVRAPTGAYDLSKAAGLQVHLRGDGKRYMWTLYTHPGGRISYRISFDAPTEWTMLTLPFDACEPYRRGRRVPGAPPFDEIGRAHV